MREHTRATAQHARATCSTARARTPRHNHTRCHSTERACTHTHHMRARARTPQHYTPRRTVRHSTAQHGTARHSTRTHATAQHTHAHHMKARACTPQHCTHTARPPQHCTRKLATKRHTQARHTDGTSFTVKPERPRMRIQNTTWHTCANRRPGNPPQVTPTARTRFFPRARHRT